MSNKFLFSHQAQFLKAPFLFTDTRFFIFSAGYGAGKTSAIATALLYWVHKLKGKKDREGRSPRILLGGVSLGHLKKTTLAYILSDLNLSRTPYVHDKKDNILTIMDVQIIMVSLARPQDVMGYDCAVALLDEIDDLGSVSASYSADLTYQAFQAVNERTRQNIEGFRPPAVLAASTSQGQRGLYRICTQFDKENTAYIRIKARTEDNWTHPPGYVDSMRRLLTKDEYLVYMCGEFLSVGSGRLFPSFDWEHNFSRIPMDKTILPDETIYISQDFNMGFFRGCAAVLRGDTIFVVKRYEFKQIMDAPQVWRYDFPSQKIIFIPDAANNKDVIAFALELRKHRITWAYRSKSPNIEDTVYIVNKMLYLNRLVFTELAKETAEGCALATRDPKTGLMPKGIGPKSPIHDTDALRYLCYFLIFQPIFKDLRKFVIDRKVQQWKDDAEEEENHDEYSRAEKGGFALLESKHIGNQLK